jgi:hypothetical protein
MATLRKALPLVEPWADGIAPKGLTGDGSGCYRPDMTTTTRTFVPEPRRKILDHAMPERYRNDKERGEYTGSEVVTLVAEGRGFVACDHQLEDIGEDVIGPPHGWIVGCGEILVCFGCGADFT